MNTKRKSRSNSARSPRARGNNDRGISMDGVYNNSYFMNSVASLVGNSVKVHTMTGSIYEGIFRTFSAQFEIVVELAHKIDPTDPLFISVDSIVEKIIFKPHDIIKLEIPDTDLEFATRDTFQTDTAISKFNGQVAEKELEPWDCPGNNVGDFDLDGTTANGWDVIEMFRQNEQIYGVTSNFDHGLSAYTTPLPNKDTKDYKDAEAKATKIANEIENNPHYKTRIDIENGDEDEKISAVTRPQTLPSNLDSNSPANCNTENANKYVCPPKRKTLQGSKVRNSMSGGPLPPLTGTAAASPTSSVATTSSTSPLSNAANSAIGGSGSSTGGGGIGSGGSTASTAAVINPGNSVGTPACGGAKGTGNINQAQLLNQSVVLLPSVHQDAPLVSRTGRQNGTTESPKPQRTSTNTRHARGASRVSARTFGNSESARFSGNGSHSHQPSQNNNSGGTSNHVIENRTHSNHHTNANFNSSVSSGENGQGGATAHQHHRKPPIPLPHPVEHQNRERDQGTSNQRKLSRGREEQIADLKKFGTDFKLKESEEACKKQNPNNSDGESVHTPVNNVIDLQPQVPEQTTQTTSISSSCTAVQNVGQQPTQSQQQQQQQQQQPQPPRPTTGHSPQDSANSNKVIKSKLNPNAKEFVYNPNAKPFTPFLQRGASTPNQSRPHTPQTPGYGPSVGPAMPAMVMPAYVVATSQQPYSQPPNQANRYRKVHMGMSQPSQMQVAAATGQPLLAPAPMHTSFTVPYSPQAHIATPPYQQMVRMVAQQSSGIVPPVLTAINYPPENAAPAQMQYMGPGSMGPHPHHGHHPPHVHPQGNAPSPQSSNSQGCGGGGSTGGGGSNQTGGGGGGVNGVTYSGGGGATGGQGQGGGYNQTTTPAPPHPGPTTFPLMCPIIQPPPHPGPTPHHMIPTQTPVHQYIHHHHPHHHSSQMGNQQHHIQVILPHSQ